MANAEGEIIVGVLGQWASGKSTAARTLIDHLGGAGKVTFIADRELVAALAVEHILELEDCRVKRTVAPDGKQRLEGELTTVYLCPEDDLETVDLNTLLFDLHDEIFDTVAPGSYNWLDRARLELGRRIREEASRAKPIVIEAGFGTNLEPRGANPFSHTVSDLFLRLDEAGVEPASVKWILVEAPYERRSERNKRRPDSVPAIEFDRFAADGGDLDPKAQKRLEEKGASFIRVSNDHDDIERFKADVIAAYEEMVLKPESWSRREGSS